jgi:hypothetical protein
MLHIVGAKGLHLFQLKRRCLDIPGVPLTPSPSPFCGRGEPETLVPLLPRWEKGLGDVSVAARSAGRQPKSLPALAFTLS